MFTRRTYSFQRTSMNIYTSYHNFITFLHSFWKKNKSVIYCIDFSTVLSSSSFVALNADEMNSSKLSSKHFLASFVILSHKIHLQGNLAEESFYLTARKKKQKYC